jgi:dTDP-4-amino-4,6-dideoxygalactose transaminase
VYKSFFEKIDNVKYIEEIDGGVANYWLNAIRFENEDDKLAFLNYSNDSGVMTRPIWKLMNKLDMFKDCPKGDLTISEMLENTIVNIPSSVRL